MYVQVTSSRDSKGSCFVEIKSSSLQRAMILEGIAGVRAKGQVRKLQVFDSLRNKKVVASTGQGSWSELETIRTTGY